MKLTFFAKPPQDVYLAFSGGIDSCVLLHNLLKRKIKVTLLHVHHNTPWCDKERDFAKQVAKDNAIKLQCFSVVGWTGGTSKECFWSKHRNDIFQKMSKPVLTGHHLNDAIVGLAVSDESIRKANKLLYDLEIVRSQNGYATIIEIARHCFGIQESSRSFDAVPLTPKQTTEQLRVTPEHIKSVVIDRMIDRIPATTVTVVTLRLRNGSCAVGIDYGAVYPEIHDWKRGLDEATKKAEEKVYELENYVLLENFRLLELDKNKLRPRATK